MEQENNQMIQRQNLGIDLKTSLSQYLPAKRPKTVADVLNSETRSLAYVIHNEPKGEMKMQALISLLITETLEFFSITNSMSDTQIGITVNLILDEYSQYKPDFFMLCFDNAKKFRYGKNYNRIDGQIIFEWLAACDDDLTLEAENQRIKEHKKLNSDVVHMGDYCTIPDNPKDRPVPMPENVKEIITTIGKKLMPVSKEVEQTPEQIQINKWINDFNEISEEQNPMATGKKYINIDGKMLDVGEYLEYRASLPF